MMADLAKVLSGGNSGLLSGGQLGAPAVVTGNSGAVVGGGKQNSSRASTAGAGGGGGVAAVENTGNKSSGGGSSSSSGSSGTVNIEDGLVISNGAPGLVTITTKVCSMHFVLFFIRCLSY